MNGGSSWACAIFIADRLNRITANTLKQLIFMVIPFSNTKNQTNAVWNPAAVCHSSLIEAFFSRAWDAITTFWRWPFSPNLIQWQIRGGWRTFPGPACLDLRSLQ